MGCDLMKYLILLLFFISSVCQASYFIPNGYITPPKFGTVTDASTLDQGGSNGKLEIKAGGVNTTQLAASAVTTAKIAAQAVTSAQLVGRSTYTVTATGYTVVAGYQYTNSGSTFIATTGATGTLYFQGTGAPAASGNLICITASGCSTAITYTAFTNGAPTALAGGIAVSGSSGVFSTFGGTQTAVTNLSVSLTTTGRPVMICMVGDGSSTSNPSTLGVFGSASSSLNGYLYYYRGATAIATHNVNITATYFTGSSTLQVQTAGPPCVIDMGASAGVNTYSVKASAGTYSISVNYFILTAFEL